MGNYWSSSLEEENKKLRAEIAELRSEIRNIRRNRSAAADITSPVRISSISRDHLLAWMDEKITEEEPDSENWVPDSLERYLIDYKRELKTEVFMMMLDSLDHILESTKIEFMGHVISFDLGQENLNTKQ